MTDVVLIGSGGHFRSTLDVVKLDERLDVLGVVVKNTEINRSNISGLEVLGDDRVLPGLLKKNVQIIVAIGKIGRCNVRFEVYQKLNALGANFPVIKSPYAYVSATAKLSGGCIIMHGSTVNTHSKIGTNTIINSHALIEHDAVVGDHVHVATGAKINGNVVLGDHAFVGSGATILQGVTVGEGAIIPAGALVKRDLNSREIYRQDQNERCR